MYPTIVFLHGDGGPCDPSPWLALLNQRLRDAGQPTIDRVVCPDYQQALVAAKSETGDYPKVDVVWRRPAEDTYERARCEYASSQERLRRRVQELVASGESFITPMPKPAAAVRVWNDVPAYLNSARVRHRVWASVLEQLPDDDEIILIGHSLGSVVAVDIAKRIQHLDAKKRIRLLMTVGSPLGAISDFRSHCSLRDDSFPFDTVSGWVNVFDPRDIVTGGHGIAEHFSSALDVPIRVQDRWTFFADHGYESYSAHKVVTELILESVIGGSLVPRDDKALEKGFDPLLVPSMLQMAYAQQVQDCLPAKMPKTRRRMEQARVDAAHTAVRACGELIDAGEISAAMEFEDFMNCPAEHVRGHLTDEQLVIASLGLAALAPMAPLEIPQLEYDRSFRHTALERLLGKVRVPELSAELQDGRSSAAISNAEFAAEIIGALKTGKSAMRKQDDLTSLIPILVGALALLTGGFGLLAAIPGGLAGGAAIAAALAAFGPGGMVGGLVTLGVLSGLGAGGIAYGLGQDSATPQERKPNLDLYKVQFHQVMQEADAASVRGMLSLVIAIVDAQERLGFTSMRAQASEAILSTLSDVRARIAYHTAFESKCDEYKALVAKRDLLAKAQIWMERTESSTALERALTESQDVA